MDTLFCKMTLLCYVVLLLQNSGKITGKINVCMQWKVHDSFLIITCKVQDLLFEVSIEDPFGTKHGHCVPPIRAPNFSQPVKCFPNYSNVTLSQNIDSGETIFIMHGKIDKSLNGNWTCLHGTDKDKGTVEVTIPGISEILKQQILQPAECGLLFFLWTILGFFVSFFLLISFVMCLIKRDGKADKGNILNTLYYLFKISIFHKRCIRQLQITAKVLKGLKIIIAILVITMIFIPVMFVGITFKNQCKDAPYFVLLGLLLGAVSAILLVDKGVAIDNPHNDNSTSTAFQNNNTPDNALNPSGTDPPEEQALIMTSTGQASENGNEP